MRDVLTVEIPDALAQQVRTVAAATNRRVEEVVLDCLSRAISLPDFALLPNSELLKLCDMEIESPQQVELSDLLARNREGQLTAQQRPRLDQLMLLYRAGLVSKARALKEAVARGLKPPLSDDAA